jgi:GH24 family phage-related lysozyme (muramidase)
MATKLSLRSLWKIYKRTCVVTGSGNKRDLAITQLAFYSGARGVLRVLAHLIEQGEYEELHETIRRHGRLIEKIQGRPLRARRH